jgi:hypothetical protein
MTCRRCGTGERRAGQGWCRSCHAAYMRVFREKKLSRFRQLRAALERLADDYEALWGDGMTQDTQPEVLRVAREVLTMFPG